MDNEQHWIQDSNEAYAVFVAQATAEEIGVAAGVASEQLYQAFSEYLSSCGLTLDDWEHGLYGKYKANVDNQVPRFVRRLADLHWGRTLEFELREKEERNLGNKADMFLRIGGDVEPKRISVKNYIGAGGITRPQVSSGTFLSFACQFVFDRVGVGVYTDTRAPGAVFQGSNRTARESVLDFESRSELIPLLRRLEGFQQEMREELLGPECEYYDPARVRTVVERIAPPAISVTCEILDIVGEDVVRDKLLAKIGMDGKEEALFFDSMRYVDSITSPRYHDLREQLNAATTQFSILPRKQSLRFEFVAAERVLLPVDIPFTINTNGAWFRPADRYAGTRVYRDKGHDVALVWGQRRPYKSREIATSTNTYVDLSNTGIFEA